MVLEKQDEPKEEEEENQEDNDDEENKEALAARQISTRRRQKHVPVTLLLLKSWIKAYQHRRRNNNHTKTSHLPLSPLHRLRPMKMMTKAIDSHHYPLRFIPLFLHFGLSLIGSMDLTHFSFLCSSSDCLVILGLDTRVEPLAAGGRRCLRPVLTWALLHSLFSFFSSCCCEERADTVVPAGCFVIFLV